MLEEGNSASRMRPDDWNSLMGDHAIMVDDYTTIPDRIISILSNGTVATATNPVSSDPIGEGL